MDENKKNSKSLSNGRDLTLRDVAQRLAKLREIKSPKSIAAEPLLSILCTGSLNAFVWYPSKVVPRIMIPADYWQTVNSDDFKQIIYRENNKKRKGTYLIVVEDLFEEYLTALFLALKEGAAADRREEVLQADLRGVARWFKHSREVVIPEVAWAELSEANGWVEKEEKGPSKARGRPVKAWLDLLPYIVAEIVPPSVHLKEKSLEMANAILEAASKDEIGNLPKPSSLIEKINTLYASVKKRREKDI